MADPHPHCAKKLCFFMFFMQYCVLKGANGVIYMSFRDTLYYYISNNHKTEELIKKCIMPFCSCSYEDMISISYYCLKRLVPIDLMYIEVRAITSELTNVIVAHTLVEKPSVS